ncbi:MAG: DUF58 domain-containing protein [Phycisphaeraceae bacterium]|nr:DUF58 domain-containing protein [Phycisphaeraceae bacterium]
MLRTPSIQRPDSIEDLLSPDLMSRLGQLDVSSRKIFAGKLKGERRSKKRGESVEFADHRPYVVGDDLRHIDWNLFGRLDRLFLKLFLEEEDLSLHLVIDASASGDCGEPHKFLFMQRLAAALAYIGLVNLNRVAITAIGGGNAGIASAVRDLRGRRRLHDVSRFLCSLTPAGPSNFTEAAKRIAITRRGKGVMIVLSDFFFKEGYDTGLRLLVGHGYDLFAIQALSPQELEPTLGGDLRLKDVEDGDTAEITVSAPLLKRYKANMNAYITRLHDFCAQRDIVHLMVKSDAPIDVLVLDHLRRRGLLK